MSLSRNRFLSVVIPLLAAIAPLRAGVPQAYKWSVQYLIDNSQTVFGRSQAVYPRAERGLAISPDGNFLYTGYIQSFNNGNNILDRNMRSTNTGEVRKIDLRIADYENATKAVLLYHRAKAIAVDDEEHVYLADGASIDVYDPDLQKSELSIPMDTCEGVAVTHEGGDLVLYATERNQRELHRFLIDTRFGSEGCQATPAGLGGSGVMTIPGALSLRGVAVDSQGRIWMADADADSVFRINPDGSGLVSATVPKAMAVAFYNDTALVTRGTDRQIALVSPDMVVEGNLAVPWEQLELAPYGNNRDSALSGIAVIPGNKGFYVVNEHGQTANQKSTYGRPDQNSEVINGKLYIDAYQDDNEPILRALPVLIEDAAAAASPIPIGSQP